MKKLLLFIAIIISSVGLFAQNVGDNTIIDYEGYSLKFTVTNLEPAECKVVCSTFPEVENAIIIPPSATIEGMEFSVTSIGDKAFSYYYNLTSIEIPNSVTSIGNYAFSYCTSLTSIEIPNSVTSIGNDAFYSCSNLTSIDFGENSQLTSIGNYAFSYCYTLTSIEIPNSVTSIGERAFSSCDNLTSIEIPNSVTSIGEWAFYECSNLTSITFEENSQLTSIGGGAFSSCTSLTSIEIPNSVTSIGNSAFYSCENLTSIEIPNSVTSIGNYAFYSCTSLTSIEIPNSVTSIGNYAFCNCDNLTSIEIPNSVTSIGNDAFYSCSNLTSIDFGENSQLTSIGNYAFHYCENLTSIEIPNSVTSIGGEAFYECSNLTSITVEDGNPVYDSRNNCNAIIETETNTLIAGCQNTIIPNSVTSIGELAFSYCYNLTSIEIPNSITSIGNYAFSYCTSLTSIEIPNSVTSIGNYAFSYCYTLTSIEIPNSVTSIGNYAFSYCYNLTSITVEEGNPVYDSRNNCNAIIETETNTLIAGCQNTIIPNSVTSIGNYAFSSCDNLTSIEIPNSVTSIGYWAFDDCENLTSIYCYAENVPETDYSSFNNCPYEMIIYVPAKSVDAYKAAFPWSNYTILALEEDEEEIEPTPVAPAAPANVLATATETAITLTWDAVENATSYNVYTPSGFATDSLGLTETTYTFENLTAGTEYCFQVSAVNEVGESALTEVCATTTPVDSADLCTVIFTLKDSYGDGWNNNYLTVEYNGVLQTVEFPAVLGGQNDKTITHILPIPKYAEVTVTYNRVGLYPDENAFIITYEDGREILNIEQGSYNNNTTTVSYEFVVNCSDEPEEPFDSTGKNHWLPDESLYANNMSVIGLIQIDGVDQNSTSLEIGAFCGEEVRGSQIVQYIPALDKYLVFLTIHGDSIAEISFKLYDHSIGQELDLRSPEAITFAVNGTLGSIANPYILNFNNMVEITASVNPSEAGVVTGAGIYAINDIATLVTTANEGFSFKNWTVNGEVVSTDMEYSFVVTEAVVLVANYNYVHTRELKSGWSWFSTFIEMEGENGLEKMTNAFGTNGSQIKNLTEFVVYSDGEWYGSLMSANTDVMYMLEASAPHSFTLFGAKVNPEELPISIGTNWRWISYPLNISLSVEDALSTIVPQTGDYIKSKEAFSQYYEGIGWIGALNTMNPGEGFMYQNVSGTTKTLVYPSAPTTRSIKENVTAENNYWVPEAGKFATNMSVIAVVENNGIEMSDYEVAAFVGDEIRGSARPIYIEALDRHMVFMTVYGNSNERIEFKYYDVNADAVENVSSKEDIVFADNATYGSVDNAIVLTCGTLGVSENDAEALNVYPNPANVNAEISLGMTYDRVEVYNAIGVKVAEYADVDRIGGIETAGVYVIKVTNDAEARNCRIVVR